MKRKTKKPQTKKPSAKKKVKFKKGVVYARHRAAAEGKRPPVMTSIALAPHQNAFRGTVIYTPELAEEILMRLATGETLTAICAEVGKPDIRTVYSWKAPQSAQYKADFAEAYALARQMQREVWADRIVDVSATQTQSEKTVEYFDQKGELTSSSVVRGDAPEHRRLYAENLKWMLERLSSDQFGLKTKTENKHEHLVVVKSVNFNIVDPKKIEHDRNSRN